MVGITMPQVLTTMATLVIDADLAMGAYNITQNDGVDLSKLFVAHDAEVTETGGAYTCKKTFTLTQDFKGDALVTFETKHSTGGASTHARIYKEGIAIGAIRDTSSTSYMFFAEVIQFDTITSGQRIQLYMYPDGGVGVATAKNFRVYDIVEATIS